jgi:hypothetical protein
MRHLAAAAAALGFVVLALAPIGPAEAAEEDAAARLLTPEQLNTPDQPGNAPLILRGSAVGPKRAAEMHASAARWQIVAGRRLWLADPATKDLRTCAVRDTSTVGVKEIRCLSGSAGRYRRTFGPTFSP